MSYKYSPEEIHNRFKGLFKDENESSDKGNKSYLKKYCEEIGYKEAKNQLNFIFSKNSCPFVFIEDFKDHGIVYRFNFRLKNALYAPIFRGYFMKKFKEKMDDEKDAIYTPMKHELSDFIPDENEEWRSYYF